MAHSFRNVCYNNRDGLSAGIICAGWDKTLGGQVYTIPLGGMCLRRPFTIGGSGSTYLYGHCDATFRVNMSLDECIEFVKNCPLGILAVGGTLREGTVSHTPARRASGRAGHGPRRLVGRRHPPRHHHQRRHRAPGTNKNDTVGPWTGTSVTPALLARRSSPSPTCRCSTRINFALRVLDPLFH